MSLTQLITSAELERLRAAYDAEALLDLKVSATSAAQPRHAPWAQAVRDTFFGPSTLAARERELCIICLLAFRDPQLGLAPHIYAGLMEGLTVEQIGEAIGLSGCYAGMPAYYPALATVQKTLQVMARVASEPEPHAQRVLGELVLAFTGRPLAQP